MLPCIHSYHLRDGQINKEYFPFFSAMQCIRKSLLTKTYSYIVLTQTDMVADSVLLRFVTRVQEKEQQIQIQINQYVVFTVCDVII